jgi:quercetin dioxygenase-like cupin family protein
MRKIIWTVSLLVPLTLSGQSPTHHNPPATSQPGMSPQHAISAGYENLQWQPIVPELGTDSPQVSILRVDPKTQATQLLIRMPKRMHVPMHWHSANETHTMIKGTMVFEHEGPAPRLWSPSRRRFGSSNGGVAARHAGRCWRWRGRSRPGSARLRRESVHHHRGVPGGGLDSRRPCRSPRSDADAPAGIDALQ